MTKEEMRQMVSTLAYHLRPDNTHVFSVDFSVAEVQASMPDWSPERCRRFLDRYAGDISQRMGDAMDEVLAELDEDDIAELDEE